ncbi:MAG: helix-turn-helix domain-containing protein [Myxococcales bacterium]|nr:helix-turn-helix domain-containing protein [Myxococcales bacterium]
MPAALSSDLRERLLDWYAGGNGTIAEAAAHFLVGTATASRWVARWRRTGERGPRPAGGVRVAALLDSEALATVRRIVMETPSLTVDEIIDQLIEAGGPRVSASTMKRGLTKLALTRKKTRRASKRSTARE